MAGPDVVLIDRSREPASRARLAQVVRALQTQVDRDLGSVWGARAQIELAGGSTAPASGWSISIVDDPFAALGIQLDEDAHPRAAVRAGEDWTLAVSHVLLEMVAAPEGRRFMEGPDSTHRSQARVRYLVEICDPCEVFSYEIDGIQVSDFVTPDYYRADAAPGTAFDFLRQVRRPLEVPRGGYLSWQDVEAGRWRQRRPDGTFSTSSVRLDPGCCPRTGRDRAFPEERDRHDLAAIRRAYAPGRRRGGRKTGGPATSEGRECVTRQTTPRSE